MDCDSVAQPTYVSKEDNPCATSPYVTDTNSEALTIDAANYSLLIGMNVPEQGTRSVRGDLHHVPFVLLVSSKLKKEEKDLLATLRESVRFVDEEINEFNENSEVSRYNDRLKVGETMKVGACFGRAIEISKLVFEGFLVQEII